MSGAPGAPQYIFFVNFSVNLDKESLRCPDGLECGEMFYTHRHGPKAPSCNRDGEHNWLPFSTNGTDGWTPDYQNIGARKTEIMSVSHNIMNNMSCNNRILL